ncbi:hypothetical protein Tco_0352174 [Tanacetum coccineum]
MIGSLMYLTASRPDIMFAVCACDRDSPFELEAFSDSDYRGTSLDRKSTTGGCQFLGRRLISWQCKKQAIVANSTTKVEYVVAANFSMENLEFVDQHNMVACLEKTEGNSDFHEIVDFLALSLIHHALTVSPTIYTSYIEQFWNTASSQTVNDVKQINATVDSKAIVTKASIRSYLLFNDADDSRDSLEETNGNEGDRVLPPHDSPLSGGHTSDRAEGVLNLQELLFLCTNLSNRVLTLESIKDVQGAEISALKSRIKRLEKKCKPSISHHRAWLKSMKRLSMKKRFRKKEYVSKQGRKKSKPKSTLDDSTVFDDQDDHGMEYIETEEAVDEGRKSGKTEEDKLTDDTKVVEDKINGDKGGKSKELVSTAMPELSTTRPDIDAVRQEDGDVEPRTPPTTTSIFDDEDITMAQTLIKMKEEKAKEKGVSIKDVDDSSRPERSILTLKPLPTIDPKDKGKGVLKESPELARWDKKKRGKTGLDQASVTTIAEFIYDEVQAKMDASEERKKLLAEERAAVVRNKPPTRTQLRSLMMTYLNHTGKYRHNQLNKNTFEEIQALYIKEQERDADFMPIGPKRDEKMIDKMNKKAAGMDEEEVPKEPESTKTDYDLKEEEQLRASIKIVPGEEEEIGYEVLGMKLFRANGSSRYIKTFTKMVLRFDRLDFIELYSLVMQRFSTTTPEGIDLVLWGDLRIMFEETADDDIWKNQEKWIIKKRRYPLIRETLERMMELRLTAESEDINNWLVQKQMAFGKDFSNLFTVDSLLKTICNEALAIPEQIATGKEISNPFMAGSLPKLHSQLREDCWVLEDFTTYYCWFNIGAASEDLVLLRKIEENRLSLFSCFVKSILLLAIPDEYLLKFHNVPDAKSLWDAIKSRFGGNDESKKMHRNEDGQSVRSHLLKIKNYLDTLERLGYAIPNELGVSLILNSLNKDYDQFIQNYNMYNMRKTIAKLHAMLKLHEKGIPKKAETPIRRVRSRRTRRNCKVQRVKTKEIISFLMLQSPRSYRHLREIIRQRTLSATTAIEPLNETKLEEVGLNCNHNTPLSSREVPSFDGPEPQCWIPY